MMGCANWSISFYAGASPNIQQHDRQVKCGKMLNLLVWDVGFLCCFGFAFFSLWTAMSINDLHCLMQPLLPRETNSVKLVYFVNLGMNQNKWFLVCV